mmetsp:Transcript_68603/g.199066  ORF Transcript_68603/g.199066 Transcript_68603/m.199066 type:complete len:83 (+) Transcript_68603:3-251(+)
MPLPTTTAAAMPSAPLTEDDHRRARLEEVRSHLALLKDFEGVIDDAELKERKRQLFYALPDAPPPADGKRARTSLDGGNVEV